MCITKEHKHYEIWKSNSCVFCGVKYERFDQGKQ